MAYEPLSHEARYRRLRAKCVSGEYAHIASAWVVFHSPLTGFHRTGPSAGLRKIAPGVAMLVTIAMRIQYKSG